MAEPTAEELMEAVRDIRDRLPTDDPAANDLISLTKHVVQDHPEWEGVVDMRTVGCALSLIIADEQTTVFDTSDMETFKPNWTSVQGMREFSSNRWFKDVYGVHHAQGGERSKGCYILFTKRGVVVLKESNPDFAREMFASVLARHLGVSAPRMRPLSLDEFKDLTEHLRSARISVKGTCGALHGPTAQEFGGVLMEFLPGEALLRTRYADAFEHAKFNRAVGRVVALDLLINNFDRLPLVWQNEGNPSNLMIEPTKSAAAYKAHAIDQALNHITDEQNRELYFDKVRACVAEARSGVLGEHAERVRVCVEGATGAKLSDWSLAAVMRGIADGADNIVLHGEDALRRAAEETLGAFANAGVAVHEELTLEFCLGARDAMRV